MGEEAFRDSRVVVSSDAAAHSQEEINAEIAAIREEYRRSVEATGKEETQPRLDFNPYRSSILRHLSKDLHHVDPETIELWSPAFGHRNVHARESDLTIQHNGQPLGERIKGREHADLGLLSPVWACTKVAALTDDRQFRRAG